MKYADGVLPYKLLINANISEEIQSHYGKTDIWKYKETVKSDPGQVTLHQ